MDTLSRIIYVWGLVGLLLSLSAYLAMLACWCLCWAGFDLLLVCVNLFTLWLNARTGTVRERNRGLERLIDEMRARRA